MTEQFGKPAGAIWARDFNLRTTLADFFSKKEHKCPKCTHEFTERVSESEITPLTVPHTLSVKVSILKEKFIAIRNTKKMEKRQPDYFLHVYQTHTGSAPIYPFPDKRKENLESGA